MESMIAFYNHSERVCAQYENVALLNDALMQTQFTVQVIMCATSVMKSTVRSVPVSTIDSPCSHFMQGNK